MGLFDFLKKLAGVAPEETSSEQSKQVEEAKDGQSGRVSVTNTYTSSGDYRFTLQQDFRIMADGAIDFSASIDPSPKGAELPRLGMRTELVKGMEQMRWLGRGPQDSYRDRKEAALVGLHHSRVSDEWTNYVLPQEQGNKEDVRWMAITNDAGVGLQIVAPSTIAASAAHWRPEDNYNNGGDRKKHPYELLDFLCRIVQRCWNRRRLRSNGPITWYKDRWPKQHFDEAKA